jgi:hypothetical protein
MMNISKFSSDAHLAVHAKLVRDYVAEVPLPVQLRGEMSVAILLEALE